MLTIYILNVGHGDSIVLQYTSSSGTAFGVIDSNRYSNQPPAALTKLRELGAENLSFVALTHPHVDHYKGLYDIFEAYRGRIANFYTFPLDHHRHGQLKKLAEIYRHVYKATDSKQIRSSLKEFVQILHHAKEFIGFDNWDEPEGFVYELAPVGFMGVQVSAISPPKKSKGTYFQMIERGEYDIVTRQNENDLSLALSIKYKDKWVILCGDATLSNWLFRRQLFSERTGEELNAIAVKLPHHGSKEDCHPTVIDYLFSHEENTFACISADGHPPHPHPDVFISLEQRNIKPFCTNLAEQCGNRIADILVMEPTIEPELLRYLNSVSELSRTGTTQPCQGDIKIEIGSDGEFAITPQYAHPCPYREEFNFLQSD